jgi:anti-sigma factor RsiW
MSETKHIDDLLHDYHDGTLPADAQRAVARHLEECATCRHAYEELEALQTRLSALPQRIDPPRDLWGGIAARMQEAKLEPQDRSVEEGTLVAQERAPARPYRLGRWTLGLAATVVVLVGLVAFWLISPSLQPGWEVAFLNETAPARQEQVRVGQWIETDAQSRAVIEVGRIGQVEVAPQSRVQLREAQRTDHRLLLEEGQIDARIWAPPRLFFVETPSALAVDLGCAYTLTVDSLGTSLLHVTSGYVELVRDGRETLVPAGAMCMARSGYGPGTAFDQKASSALREALIRYDFEDGRAEALTDILAEVRATDGITLWQLFFPAKGADRARIYDRLAELIPPPAGVTREGVLGNDPDMLDRWQRHLGLAVMSWKGYVKKKK